MNKGLYNSQSERTSNFRQLVQERIDKANPHRELTAEEAKRLARLEAIAEKLKRGENVQNRQLKTWLSEQEYEQLDYEWKEQLELRSEAEVADTLAKVREATELGELDALLEKQAQFGRRVTQKN